MKWGPVRWFFVGGMVFSLYLASLCGYGMHENIFRADVAVVLGNKVHTDGTCSRRLAARLNRAIALYHEGMCQKIIVSGGVDKMRVNEAKAMREYLLAHGIPYENIVVDEYGVNTRATAEFTAEYMEKHRLRRAIAVTQYFHIARTRLALSQEGVPLAGHASPAFFEMRDLFSILREGVGFPAYLLHLR